MLKVRNRGGRALIPTPARPARDHLGLVAGVLLLAVLIAACGDVAKSEGSITLMEAGQAQVEPPEPTDLDATRTTLPVAENEQPAIVRLASDFSAFQDCLDRHGQAFIGIPNEAQPETMDPNYIQALQTCATETNILETLEDFNTENEALEPDQIEARNETMILVGDCLTRKGWDWPALVADENGLLLPGGFPQPPPGADGTRDMNECAFENEEVTELAEDAGFVEES